MATEVKSNKRVQATTAAREVVLREAAVQDMVAMATITGKVSPVFLDKSAKQPSDANLYNLPVSRRDELDPSLPRKKKKLVKETETNESPSAGAAAVENSALDSHANKHDAQMMTQTDSVHVGRLDASSSEMVKLQHGSDAPTTNLFEGYSFEMMLELLGGAMVGGISSAIANAYLKTSDTTAPSAPVVNTVAGDNVIRASEATNGVFLTGTNEAGATTTIAGHAVVQYTATDWYYLLGPSEIAALGQGQVLFTTESTDKVGNKSMTSKSVLIDTVAPVAATMATVAGDDVISAAERDVSVIISGTNESGATVTVNGNAATVSGNTWSYTLTSAAINALGQGTKTLSVVSSDAVGNTTTTTKQITVDTVAPTTPPQIQLAPAATYWSVNPQATIHTSLGDIVVELNPNAAPVSTANWLSYVDNGFYTDLIFHRVISSDFMSVIQGGGFDASLNQITPTYSAITLESNNGLSNTRGTIAMARTNVANSATDQFYINTADNTSLDYTSSSSPGYAVFGQVISGMSVVDAIQAVSTATTKGMDNVPVTPVTITSVDHTVAGTAYSTGLVNLIGLETGSHWEYALDGSTSWVSSSTSLLNLGSPDGAHALAVRQVDAAGNASATSNINIILDHSAPVFSSATTVADLSNHAAVGQLIYTAAATDAGVGQLLYALKAGSDAGLSINSTSGAVTMNASSDYAVQSAYDFTVVATDKLGNQSEMHLTMAVLPV